MSLDTKNAELLARFKAVAAEVAAAVGQVWFLSDEDDLVSLETGFLQGRLTPGDWGVLLDCGQLGFDSEWCSAPGRLVTAAGLAAIDEDLRGEAGSHE